MGGFFKDLSSLSYIPKDLLNKSRQPEWSFLLAAHR
jgi:hypothetical protein